jgi:TetR/AcrR family transcriptional repressor of nem operon
MKKQPTREKLLDITFEEVYKNGYSATSIDSILKIATVPKGSMYHHFKSKKELVLAMVNERLFPKMDEFFIFEIKDKKSVKESLRDTYSAMAKNRKLITYGCPLYRLMVELSPVDSDFDKLLSSKVIQMQNSLASMLQIGLDRGEFSNIEPIEMAKFILNATWGLLSLSPNLSSKKEFLKQSKIILQNLR